MIHSSNPQINKELMKNAIRRLVYQVRSLLHALMYQIFLSLFMILGFI